MSDMPQPEKKEFLDHVVSATKTKKRTWSTSFRLAIIILLTGLFLIPSFMVQMLIEDRSYHQEDAIQEVSQKWGGQQVIGGPVLAIPYDVYTEKGEYIQTEQAYFLAENLSIDGTITPVEKYRGIYQIPTYSTNLRLSGSFTEPDLDALRVNRNNVKWEEASLLLGIADMRGVAERVELDWNGEKAFLEQGLDASVFQSHLAVPVVVDTNAEAYAFTLDVSLRGTKALFALPTAKETKMNLAAEWPSPSFDGAFLPDESELSATNFTASWTVLDINRNFPQQWTSQQGVRLLLQGASTYESYVYPAGRYRDTPMKEDVYNDAFGVRLYTPVDIYQKTTRSAKYAIAMIALVFLIFFMTEVIAKRRVHPLQYLLVGIALCVFYTLLLSLAEYLSFATAYVIATIAVVLMIGLFAKSVLKSKKLGMMTGGLLLALYLFSFTLIQMAEYTLLVGSFGLFVILAVLMYVSKFVVWYEEE